MLRYGVVLALALLGGLTVFLTGSVLLDLFGIRQKEGNFVPFIVWANLLAGALYLLAAWGLFRYRGWTVGLLSTTTLLMIGAFVALQQHIQAGGLYKTETVNGMLFRVGFTALAAVAAYFLTRKKTMYT